MQHATSYHAKGVRLSALGLAVLLLVALAGCANPARPDKMAVEAGERGKVAVDSAFYQAVTIADVWGGLETDRYWGYPAIDNPEIEGALRLSLARAPAEALACRARSQRRLEPADAAAQHRGLPRPRVCRSRPWPRDDRDGACLAGSGRLDGGRGRHRRPRLACAARP